MQKHFSALSHFLRQAILIYGSTSRPKWLWGRIGNVFQHEAIFVLTMLCNKRNHVQKIPPKSVPYNLLKVHMLVICIKWLEVGLLVTDSTDFGPFCACSHLVSLNPNLVSRYYFTYLSCNSSRKLTQRFYPTKIASKYQFLTFGRIFSTLSWNDLDLPVSFD